jgi:hypothetical protein
MYDSFKCSNPDCGVKSYYETCGHVESRGKMVPVCTHCYYAVVGHENEHYGRTLEQYLESLEDNRAHHKKRNDFIAKIKKHCQFFAQEDGMKVFALIEKRLALQLFDKERKDLTMRQEEMLMESMEGWFGEVFPRKLKVREMIAVTMVDRYENSRYEELCKK